jgi:hypothetical protein
MHKKPRLIGVHVIPWEPNRDLYGIACWYDDGVVEREIWGSQSDTIVAVQLRARDIFTAANLNGSPVVRDGPAT